ncbi:BTAD domain-containing putative transcriptional regulator [Amycolatopsis sp. 195334CR]|uniref:AfsR/SARP family transcriptional regulator n=1 Tax=Amycolatopsis sp. 195334CR TaxID=2814588 RepID=UPI001A8EA5C4|nr:BTAD domain-containing putative transcriptional regulator [Amycolatopsis sp. 195334CR]MBN6038119.1 tetratricopeptide repeat protein [Amycolatopsis sp. 195334CR]
MSVEFGLLGEVRAQAGGVAVDLGHARQRCVLAALLVEPNRPQALDVLIERVWGERPPRQARNTLYGYLYRLRQALGEVHAGIDRTAGGYLLPVDEDSVDLHRFRSLVRGAAALGDEEALAQVESALALWRGQALGGVDGEWVESVRRTLEQERWQAVLHRNDLALRLGGHDALVAELPALSAEHPLDERLAGQLMLALYRSGRQADALGRYQEIRHRLAEELGADPGPLLRKLHQQVLEGEQAVATRTPTPRQLPSVSRLFAGRADQLARMDKALAAGDAPALAVVGAAGVGKSTLVLHWAHRALDRFPDGQLHADLRGFDPAGPPVSPSAVLRRFLEALGVPAGSAPAEPDAQAALYRSLVAGKRMLVVLDNARDAEQVLPLLPGNGGCTVLITSRHRLTGLAAGHGFPLLDLEVLPDDDARELLARHLAEQRLREEPEAVEDLLRWCAGLPLALGLVAARATVHPGFPLDALVVELRAAEGWDAGEASTSLRAVFTTSYRVLPPEAARAFALLGVAPGPDIGLPAVAALLALPVPRVRELVRHLETVHLVRQHAPGRYRMHDLVRTYAAERAEAEYPDEVAPALGRVIDAYAKSGLAAENVLYPYETPAAVGPAEPDPAITDEATALSWLTTEYPSLLAAQDAAARLGLTPAVLRLAWALDTFQRRQGHFEDQLAVWRAALAAADEPGQRALAAWRLGAALARAGELAESERHLDDALTLSRESADVSAEANVHQALAWVRERHGDDATALHHGISALDILRELGVPMREAHALNQAGWYAAKVGDLTRAQRWCEDALEICRRHGDRDAEARTLDSLAYIAHLGGRYDDAIPYYEAALAGFEDAGAAYDYADTLERLADSLAAAGHAERARSSLGTALSMFRDQHRQSDVDRLEQRVS